jgi:hypothetical protein
MIFKITGKTDIWKLPYILKMLEDEDGGTGKNLQNVSNPS